MEQVFAISLQLLHNTWTIWLEVAPWLLGGLILAGVLKVFLPSSVLQRWLGGEGIAPILKAAVIGTPIPLCSCSVLPAALQLRRSGASKGATMSFLVATPENGADSIALSYVLLGPVMTILRPVAAIVSAITTGMVVDSVACSSKETDGLSEREVENSSSCCGETGCCARNAQNTEARTWRKAALEIADTALDLFDDMAGWLAVGIVVAGVLETLVPPNGLSALGSGLGPMLMVAVVSVPMYICATASTPIAASMLAAGVSPGTVLVFLLAGPATNFASAAILRKEFGLRVTSAYLAGVVGSSLALGMATDLLFRGMNLHVSEQLAATGEILPGWISTPIAIAVGLLAARSLRPLIWRGK